MLWSIRRLLALSPWLITGFASACGGESTDSTDDGGQSGAGGSAIAGTGGSTVIRTPKVHRAAAVPCDGARATTDPNIPAGPTVVASCAQHDDCTEGRNGRCTGNYHDGWRCTYDACTVDADCGGIGVCACEGGPQTDNDVCLVATCRVDADCGESFCSPSLGECGAGAKYVTFACHTPEDECIDDEDCVPDPSSPGSVPSCKFEQSVGHWKCSSQACIG